MSEQMTMQELKDQMMRMIPAEMAKMMHAKSIEMIEDWAAKIAHVKPAVAAELRDLAAFWKAKNEQF